MTIDLDLLVVGAMKGGTTSLDAWLRERGDVRLPAVKETYFFEDGDRRPMSWYAAQFAPPDGRPAAEVAPSLLVEEGAPARVAGTAPAALIVMCVRDPVDRALSHRRHLVSKGDLSPDRSLSEAIAAHPAIVEHSRYGAHAGRWIDAVGNERFSVIRTEQLSAEPSEVAAQLGLPPTDHQVGRTYAATEPRWTGAVRVGTAALRRVRRSRFSNAVPPQASAAVKRLLTRHTTQGDTGGLMERAHLRALLREDTAGFGELVGAHVVAGWRDGDGLARDGDR